MEGHRNVTTFKDGINMERINFYREQGKKKKGGKTGKDHKKGMRNAA